MGIEATSAKGPQEAATRDYCEKPTGGQSSYADTGALYRQPWPPMDPLGSARFLDRHVGHSVVG